MPNSVASRGNFDETLFGWSNMDTARANLLTTNLSIHATTKERPEERLALERQALLPLPEGATMPLPRPATPRPLPVESLQHPLAVYDELIEVFA